MSDPWNKEPEGEEGIPGEFVDRGANLPGDEEAPTVTEKAREQGDGGDGDEGDDAAPPSPS